MKRRTFLQNSTLAGLGLGLGWPVALAQSAKTHILTLSFDDGFRRSFLQAADIYESVGLSACFNVIASAHLADFEAPDDYILPELMGDFEDWNRLVARGHEVMPHGWKHAWLNRMPAADAKALIGRSIDYFTTHLDGFDPQKAVFNFPFNASTPALHDYTLSRVGALRTSATGKGDPNPLPSPEQKMLYCSSFGPKNIDRWVNGRVKAFLATEGGWLILNVHGLDGEGWGPMSSRFLEKLLRRLVRLEQLAILPAARALFG